MNVLSIRKWHFSLLGRILSDKVENVFWECFQNYLNPKFVVASILEYSFQVIFMPKVKVLSVLRWHFSFFAAFGVRKLKLFSVKAVYSWYLFRFKVFYNILFRENVFKLPWAKKQVFCAFESDISYIFCKFLSGEVENLF